MSDENLFIDFQDYLKSIILYLNILGLYTSEKKMKYQKLFAIYCIFSFFFIMFFVNITQFIYMFFKADSVQSFAEVGYLANICMTANIKAYFLFRKRNDLKQIFEDINDQHFQPKSKEDKLSAEKDLKLFWKVKIAITIVSQITCTVAILLPMVYPAKGRLPVTAWFPIDSSVAPVYQLVYIYQAFGVYFDHVIYVQGDMLATILMTFIGIQCDFLCSDLRRGNKTSFKEYTDYHRRIMRFAEKSQELFSEIYLYQFFATTTGLCMALFLLSVNKPSSFEFFYLFMFQLAVFNLLLIPSWFSSEMTRKSENIPLSAYSQPWVDAPKNIRRDLVFFIHRTQTPIQFKAINFFNISISTFLSIVQSSFSYYTLLKNI